MNAVPITTGGRVGIMATFPPRFDILPRSVGSIAPQLDRLYLYVNDTTQGLPDLSGAGCEVVVLDGRDHAGDLSANGKVYPLRYLRKCRVFMLDDDFVFPHDYVARNDTLMDLFDGYCVTTTHGSILPPRVDWYYERTGMFMSTRAVRAVQICTLAGSGTLCFDQRRLVLDERQMLADVMVDLRISLAARNADLPLLVLPRAEGWLVNMPREGLLRVLSREGLTSHTRLARDIDWSFHHYARILKAAIARAGVTARQIGLDSVLAASLKTGALPPPWQRSLETTKKYNRYLQILVDQAKADGDADQFGHARYTIEDAS